MYPSRSRNHSGLSDSRLLHRLAAGKYLRKPDQDKWMNHLTAVRFLWSNHLSEAVIGWKSSSTSSFFIPVFICFLHSHIVWVYIGYLFRHHARWLWFSFYLLMSCHRILYCCLMCCLCRCCQRKSLNRHMQSCSLPLLKQEGYLRSVFFFMLFAPFLCWLCCHLMVLYYQPLYVLYIWNF